jgi:hypothetical protein
LTLRIHGPSPSTEICRQLAPSEVGSSVLSQQCNKEIEAMFVRQSIAAVVTITASLCASAGGIDWQSWTNAAFEEDWSRRSAKVL